MPWPKTGATLYNAELGLPDKGRAIKWLVVCNSMNLEPWDLLKLSCLRLLSTVPCGMTRMYLQLIVEELHFKKYLATLSLIFCKTNLLKI